MVSLRRGVQSRTDCILGTYRCLCRNVAVRYPQHNSDHYIFLGFLHSAPLREHTKYLGQSTRIPLQPPTTLTREDGIFADLRSYIPNPKSQEDRKNMWISEDTWRLINKRVSARWDPTRSQTLLRRLGRAINASLKGDQRQRT